MFRCKITLFSAFFHGIEGLVLLQVITLILTLSHSKQCFLVLLLNYAFGRFFCTEKGFRFFAGYHTNSS